MLYWHSSYEVNAVLFFVLFPVSPDSLSPTMQELYAQGPTKSGTEAGVGQVQVDNYCFHGWQL